MSQNTRFGVYPKNQKTIKNPGSFDVQETWHLADRPY